MTRVANVVAAWWSRHEARQAGLFEQIGRLKMELGWLKKKADSFM